MLTRNIGNSIEIYIVKKKITPDKLKCSRKILFNFVAIRSRVLQYGRQSTLC